MTSAELRAMAARFPSLPLVLAPTFVEPMPRLSAALGGGPKLLIKRDDALPFAFGGNKVRKAALVAARAQADGCDTLITAGAIQSNHARVTAAAAARLGMRAVLVVNGVPPAHATGNLLLDSLLGAELVFVDSREAREKTMRDVAARIRAEGGCPVEIPIGASTPLGALGLALGIAELAEQIAPPAVIIHATSSGGTQAGLTAGCRLLEWPTRVIGVSADGSAAETEAVVSELIDGLAELIQIDRASLARGTRIEVDDTFVGGGYGIPSAQSREAIDLVARTESIFLDPVYTSKAMAGLMAYVRRQRFADAATILFWHTGGQTGLFA